MLYFQTINFVLQLNFHQRKTIKEKKYQTQLKVNENNALRQICDGIDFYNVSEGY